MATAKSIKNQKLLGLAAIVLGGIAVALGIWDLAVEQDGAEATTFIRAIIPGTVVGLIGVITLIQAQKKEKELQE